MPGTSAPGPGRQGRPGLTWHKSGLRAVGPSGLRDFCRRPENLTGRGLDLLVTREPRFGDIDRDNRFVQENTL